MMLIISRSEATGWKPALDENAEELPQASSPSSDSEDTSAEYSANDLGRLYVEQKLRQKIYVQHFEGDAGAIMDDEEAEKFGFSAYTNSTNIYAPFYSEIDWNVGKWAKLRGPSSAAVTELFEIPQVC